MMSDSMYEQEENICVVMPALNENNAIDGVIAEIHKSIPGCRILIIDDGSIKPIKLSFPNSLIEIIRSEKNMGVGSALYVGLKIAIKRNYNYIITIDSDGQHDPAYIEKLLQEKENFDLIIGNRNMETYPWGIIRLIAHQLLKKILHWKFHLNLIDPTSGFRLFNLAAAKCAIQEIGDEYLEDTVVLYAKLKRREINIGQVKCEFKQRDSGEPSHQGFRLAGKYIASLLQLLLMRGE
jgi:glycosyltransferase involved in cell wall biosynthesis